MSTMTPEVRRRTRGKCNVLVVDDCPDIQELHARFLEASGFEVYTAGDGQGALDVARTAVPDVVVADITMPVMNGFELCERLRADHATRYVPIVLVTGDPSPEARVAAERSGCDVVLGKPCSGSLLLATVRLLLERPHAAGRLDRAWTVACA